MTTVYETRMVGPQYHHNESLFALYDVVRSILENEGLGGFSGTQGELIVRVTPREYGFRITFERPD